jgi:hypothetical protein
LDKPGEDLSHFDRVSRARTVVRDPQNAGVDRLDVLRRLFPLEHEQGLAAGDRRPIGLEPFPEGSLFHRPSETGNHNFNRHE